MVVLDTNVISELMKHRPDPRVIHWLDSCDPDAICTTAVSVAETMHGIAVLPAGKRRDELSRRIRPLFDSILRGRIIAFDGDAAVEYARIRALRQRLGKPTGVADSQIAACALARGAAVATRNVADFEHVGIAVVNPWGVIDG